nr:reverse transcriptase domain-containing protein [Tanacetum cinerariifolium]
MAMTVDENFESESHNEEQPFEKLNINTDYKIKTSLEEPPTDLELEPLPDNLEYIFLEEPSFLPVIISSKLSAQNKSKLVFVLKKHKETFARKTNDVPGIIVRVRVFHRRADIKEHSFSPNSKIELFLFNSNNYINGVEKGSSQNKRNFAIFFHCENNKIGRKGLRVLRDSFAYTKYGIRLMLAPRLAKALQEKVLLKLHRIRKLPGSLSFGGTLF